MQPVGNVSISGPSMEMPFAKNALDTLGVRADFFQREEYKSAMENFTNSQMSSSNSQAIESLLSGLSYKMLNEVSTDRNIPKHIFSAEMNKGILTGAEALEAKIIDRLDYGDVMLSSGDGRPR